MQYKNIKKEFLQDAIRFGIRDKLPPKLRQWWGEFEKPLAEAGTGRLANRFPIELRMELSLTRDGDVSSPNNLGIYGRAGIGTAGRGSKLSIRAKADRSVMKVLAGMGVGLNAVHRHSVVFGQVHRVRVKFGRMRGDVEREMAAVEKAVERCCFALGIRWEGFLALGRWNWRLPEGLGIDPWRLFVTMTAMKLAVLRPELWEGDGDRDPRFRVRNAIGWWRGLDDEARLVHAFIRKPRGHKIGESNWLDGWDLEFGGDHWDGTGKRSWYPPAIEGDADALTKVKFLLTKCEGEKGRWNLPVVRRVPGGTTWLPLFTNELPLNLQDLWVQGDVQIVIDRNYNFAWNAGAKLLELSLKTRNLRKKLLDTGVFGVCGEDKPHVKIVKKAVKSKVIYP